MSGHVRQRSAGTFEIRYPIGADPATGRRRTATTTLRGSRRQAERELRRLMTSVDNGTHADPNRLTVGQWFETWLESVKANKAPRTYQTYRGIADLYIAPTLGGIRLSKLTALDIQRAYTGWATTGRADGRPGPVSLATRRYVHKILTAALRRAVKLRLISANPCDAFRGELPAAERRQMVTLTPDQQHQLLGAANESIRIPILLSLASGIRRNEALAARWSDVDLDRRVLTVSTSLEQIDGAIRIKPPKNGKARSIVLPAYAAEQLRQHKKDQAEGMLRLGIRQTPDTFICARVDGTVTTPAALTTLFRRLAKKLDLPDVHFHSLRHTNATSMLESGVNPRIAQERLGHFSVSLTLDLYSHATVALQEDAAAKIDQTFRRKR
jgi:integrase